MPQQRIEQPPQQLDLLSRDGEGRVAAQHIKQQPLVRLQRLGPGKRLQQVETHPGPAERERHPDPGPVVDVDLHGDERLDGRHRVHAGLVPVAVVWPNTTRSGSGGRSARNTFVIS
jgi:hypothetical protein